MSRHSLTAMTAVMLLIGASSALNAQVMRAEHATLAPNTPGQSFRIFADFAADGDAIDGALLDVFIAKGGDLGDPAGQPGPKIESINLQPVGGVLSAFSSSQNVAQLENQFVEADILRAASDDGISSAFDDQLLAVVTVDTTGFFDGTFSVDLENSGFGIASTFTGGSSGTIPTTLMSGSISIPVPEPSALAMLFATAAGTVAVRRPRRRTA